MVDSVQLFTQPSAMVLGFENRSILPIFVPRDARRDDVKLLSPPMCLCGHGVSAMQVNGPPGTQRLPHKSPTEII